MNQEHHQAPRKDWGSIICAAMLALVIGFLVGVVITKKYFPRDICSYDSKRFRITRENPQFDSTLGLYIAANRDQKIYGITLFDDKFNLEGLYAKDNLVKIDIYFPRALNHPLPEPIAQLHRLLDSLKAANPRP